jgi:hypothetical protein
VASTKIPERGGPCCLLKLWQMGHMDANERGPSLVGSLGSFCRYKRFLYCLGCSVVSPVQNILFPRRTLFFTLFFPTAQKAGQVGRQSCRVACLLVCVSAHDADHRVHIERRLLISGVHPFMVEKSSLAGKGGGCTPTPSHYIYHHQ